MTFSHFKKSSDFKCMYGQYTKPLARKESSPTISVFVVYPKKPGRSSLKQLFIVQVLINILQTLSLKKPDETFRKQLRYTLLQMEKDTKCEATPSWS